MVSTLPSLSLNQAALPTGVLATPSTVRRPGWSYSSNSTPRLRSSATSASRFSTTQAASWCCAVPAALEENSKNNRSSPLRYSTACASLLGGGETELVRIPGAGPRQVAGRDGGVHVTAAQHTALRWSSGATLIITPTGADRRAGSPEEVG